MKVGIIEGGINGLFIAWRFNNLGYNVELYETGKVLDQTSHISVWLAERQRWWSLIN